VRSVYTVDLTRTVGLWFLIPIPVRKHLLDPGGVGQAIHVLEILLGKLERSRRDVGDVFPNQLARIDGGLVDLLEQEGSERLDTGAEESGVEWHVNTLEWDGCETSLQIQWFGLGLCLLRAFLDNLNKMGFHIFN